MATFDSAVFSGVPHFWLNGSAGMPAVPGTISMSAVWALSTFVVKRKVGDKHQVLGGLVRKFYLKLLQRAGISI